MSSEITTALEIVRLGAAIAEHAPDVVRAWREALDTSKTEREAVAAALATAQQADRGPMRDAFDVVLTSHRERIAQKTAIARASVADVSVLRRLLKSRDYTAEEAMALLRAADHVESDVT